jgi:hypothetical protein
MTSLSSARAGKAVIALRLLLMPLQRLMEIIHDAGIPSRMAGGLRVFFQPGLVAPDEMTAITRKIEAALALLRDLDPVNAETFMKSYSKIYVTSHTVLMSTSSGAPKLPKSPLLNTSVPIIGSFLLYYVPVAKAGIFRAVWQLVDPVPIMIEMRELQIAFLRAAEPDSSDARNYIRDLEGQIAILRPQLRGGG